MKDFLSESLEYISEDLLTECDEYVAELLAKKEKRSRRRKMLALWMRAGASAALVIAVVVTGFWAGWEKLNPKTPGLAYTVYDSFREAAMVIGENTLLSRLPAMETERVAIYDSSANSDESWANIVCNGSRDEYEVVLEIAQQNSLLPERESLLWQTDQRQTKIYSVEIGPIPVQYTVFEKGIIVPNTDVFIALFYCDDIFYRFKYKREDSDPSLTVAFALDYLQKIIEPALCE